MAKVGYARVSSAGQSLDVQLEKLKGCDKLFQEKRSGRTDDRPQWRACLEYVREGDTLAVTRLDRLARSTRDLLNIVAALGRKGVALLVLDQSIDTATPAGKLMLAMLAAIAEFENDLRRERQADGIALAKARGVRLGRKATLTGGQVDEMRRRRAAGAKIKDLMKDYGLSKSSVYRLLGGGGQ